MFTTRLLLYSSLVVLSPVARSADVGMFAAFIESLAMPEALAARLKRVAGRPRLLSAELARAGEAQAANSGGQLAAMLSGLTESQAAGLLAVQDRCLLIEYKRYVR